VESGKLLEEIKKSGFKILILSGGEPLLRDDIFEIAGYAAKIGLHPVLGTNGTLLTPEAAVKLRDAGVTGVAVSLDSVDCDRHDDFRNSSGAWRKAVEGIKNAQNSGLRVQINMTLTGHNSDEFGKMADFAVELGVQSLHPFFLVPAGRGKGLEEDSLKQANYFRMIRTVLEKQKSVPVEMKPTCAPQFMPMARDKAIPMRFSRGCLAGIAYCCILPDGDVNICPYLPVKAGNVRDTPFDRIWAESGIFRKLRDFSEYEGRCGKCPDIGICGGCRARAFYYNNSNYMAQEPWCYKTGGAFYG
jgi:radical SAM protein with 4Fe4S-binding SPASM domain